MKESVRQRSSDRDGEQGAVDEHDDGDDALEGEVLRDVVGEGAHLAAVGPRRQVQRLRDFQPLLQVTPEKSTMKIAISKNTFHRL